MANIRTATGKEYLSDYLAAIPTPTRLYIRVLNTNISTVAEVFANPAETRQLWHDEQYFAGYTKLIAIVPEGAAIKVVLSKE